MYDFNGDRAAGCVIGYNTVVAAVRYAYRHHRIPPQASRHVHRVLRVILGTYRYKLYRFRTRWRSD